MAEPVVDLMTSYYFWGYVGLVAGGALILRNAVRNRLAFPLAVITLTAAVYGGFLGTRLLFVLQYDAHLLANNWRTGMVFWVGGLSWLGGLLPGALAAALVLGLARRPVWENLGAAAPGVALAHAIARVGCLFQGCCYGAPTTVPWAIYSSVLQTRVHPTQVYSMVCEVLCLAILQCLWRRPAWRKYLFPLYCLLLSIHRFGTEALRGTPAGPELISGLRFYQSICIMLFALSAATLLVLWNRKRGGLLGLGLLMLTACVFWVCHPASEAQLALARKDADRYLVVTRSVFMETLSPWAALRRSQGFEVDVGEWQEDPCVEEVTSWLNEHARGACSFILLVGDCAPLAQTGAPWALPSPILADGSASDTLYADLDGDRMPDVPVGRIPVRSAGELKTQIAKIEEYEGKPPGADSLRTALWLGVPRFETVVEAMSRRVDELLPNWSDVFLLCGVTESPFCGHMPEQPEAFLNALSRPAVLAAVVSHGSEYDLTTGMSGRKPVYLSMHDLMRFAPGQPNGPLFLFACKCGLFNNTHDPAPCLAEAFCAHRNGPIGVFASTGAINPLTNYAAVQELARTLNQGPGPPETVGDLCLAMQRRVLETSRRGMPQFVGGDSMTELLVRVLKEPERDVLNRPSLMGEEILSYNLLGDPACRLWAPRALEAEVDVNGSRLTASGTAPEGCTELIVDIVYARRPEGRLREGLGRSAERTAFAEANRPPTTLLTQKISPGDPWSITCDLPESYLSGEGRIRVVAAGRCAPYCTVRQR